ncbi:MAG TPA: hypothetical protein VFQ51_01645 [Vicinamibacteria bacterium]|nr:hypothetical protein [Vicinamibacteria bacterium]
MELVFTIGVGVAVAAMFMGRYARGAAHPAAPSEDALRAICDRLTEVLAGTGRNGHVSPYTFGPGQPQTQTDGESGLRFTVLGLCPSVTLWRPAYARPRVISDAAAEPVGEPEFDALLRAAGPVGDRLALLGADTRAAIRDLLRGSVRVGQLWLEGGTLVVDVPTSGFAQRHPGLDQGARLIARLAAAVVAPNDVPARLSRNVACDPAPGVRWLSLRTLLEDHAAHHETREAIGAALTDADESLRLEAALAAKSHGRETLIALAIAPTTSGGCAARAIEALGPDLPLHRMESLVRESAKPPHLGSRPAAIHAFIAALARAPGDAAMACLRDLLFDAHEPSYGPDVVDAIARGSRPGAEAALLPAVQMRGVARPRTVEAAVIRLGAVGTAGSVLPLREAASHYGGSIARAAKLSIAAIQERIAGTPGRLALTDSDAGPLAEVPDASGRVTLPDEG